MNTKVLINVHELRILFKKHGLNELSLPAAYQFKPGKISERSVSGQKVKTVSWDKDLVEIELTARAFRKKPVVKRSKNQSAGPVLGAVFKMFGQMFKVTMTDGTNMLCEPIS